MFNLLLNGVQATAAPGSVVVEVAAVEQDDLPAGLLFDHGAVALRVSDTGGGIAPEVRERLFDPFITTKTGGTGLGLPVVQRAVEAHSSVVLVDSDARGARFTVLLPTRQGVGRGAWSVERPSGEVAVEAGRGPRAAGRAGAPPDLTIASRDPTRATGSTPVVPRERAGAA